MAGVARRDGDHRRRRCVAVTTTVAAADHDASAWMVRAACRGTDPDLFFPGSGEPADEATAVCGRCPVREPCGEYGRDMAGIWGGLRPRERKAGRRRDEGHSRTGVQEPLQQERAGPYSSAGTHTTTKETPPMAAKKKSTAPAATATTADESGVPARAKSTVPKEGTTRCPVCKQTMPVTKFPTVRNAEGVYERSTDECRGCRDTRRAAAKAAAGKGKK